MEKQLIIAQDEWKEEQNLNRKKVDHNDISDVVSMITGIPVNSVKGGESKKLASLESILKEKVIGQENAISIVSKAIQRNRIGLKNPNRPIGSFIFLGQTGVGKTQIAKVIAT